MRAEDKAIAVLDSGVGGLTVVQELFRQLPNERIVYFGDTAHMPYGPRPYGEVRRFVFQILDFLQRQEIKLVVIACNSASAAGLSAYQEQMAMPVLGVIEPGVRAALDWTKTKKIGVIGTTGTINSGAYEEAIGRLAPEVKVFSRPCPLFVLLVENDLVHTPEALSVAREYLLPLKAAGIDTLILGCTHYPLLSGVIAEVMGGGVRLISSAEETARQVRAVLAAQRLFNRSPEQPRHCFFVSGQPQGFAAIGSQLLQQKITAYQVILNDQPPG